MNRPETTPLDDDTAKAIAGNVALVQDNLLADQGIAPDAWKEAVTYLSGFIERQRVREDRPDTDRLIDVLGSYLGEAAVQLYGGTWVRADKDIGVDISGLLAFPFNKTRKQFENGIVDNISGFLTAIPAIQKRSEDD